MAANERSSSDQGCGTMKIAQINWLRKLVIDGVPDAGARFYQMMKSIERQTSNTEQQGNVNPQGQPNLPPPIQDVQATGQNGVLHVSITHNGVGLQRGAINYIEHADNPNFINPQIRCVGDSRSYTEFVGNDTRYVRAYNAVPGSGAGQIVVHGGATPIPVNGGGSIGPPAYLPSQGSGTGAPGQGGVGPGPVPQRTETSGFDWSLQQAHGGLGSPSLVGQGDVTGGGVAGGGGGGGSASISEPVIAPCEWLSSVSGTNTIVAVTATPYQALAAGFLVRFIPANTNSGAVTLNVNSIGAKAVTKNGTTALAGGELLAGKEYVALYDGTRFQVIGSIAPANSNVLASDANGVPVLAALPDTNIWIGNVSNAPASHAVSGDATLADTGVLTVTGANGAAIPTGQSVVGTNVNGQFVAGTAGTTFTSSSFTPVLNFGGAATGITYTTQSGYYTSGGGLVICWIYLVLTSKGSATGAATITGLPFAVGAPTLAAGGYVNYALNLTGLTSIPTVLTAGGGSVASLYQWGAAGVTALADTAFTNTTNIAITVEYHT